MTFSARSSEYGLSGLEKTDFHAGSKYYRFIKQRFEQSVGLSKELNTYPDPVDHCYVCDWWSVCNDRRRADDHLSFVAGISRLQVNQLRSWSIPTLSDLAGMPIPLQQRPKKGSPEGFVKVREQARLQLERRQTGQPVYELLALEAESGLARLPEPSAGDIFLDFEADPFVENGGLEYLLGYVALNETGDPDYFSTWAFDRAAERHAFESFMDMVMARRAAFPDLHIYHYSPYEPGALKRLMGRYASREDEMDQLLRAGVFVDLYRVVKQSMRASVETYSLKELEVFYGFERMTPLMDARRSLRQLECALELNDVGNLSEDVCKSVQAYNREDCVSTLELRNWLENIRHDLIARGNIISRPVVESDKAPEPIDERRARVLELTQRLLRNVSDDPAARTADDQARWIMAHLLEWHRREDKVSWWEYYRLRELTDEELLQERAGLSGLRFLERIGGTPKCPVDRYGFPPQEFDIHEDDELKTSEGRFGTVDRIDSAGLILDVKKASKMAEVHPPAVFSFTKIRSEKLSDSLFRLGSWIAEHGIDAAGPYRAARDLLLRKRPTLHTGAAQELCRPGEDLVSAATRLALELDHGVLPIQGPPGAGKTYTAAQ